MKKNYSRSKKNIKKQTEAGLWKLFSNVSQLLCWPAIILVLNSARSVYRRLGVTPPQYRHFRRANQSKPPLCVLRLPKSVLFWPFFSLWHLHLLSSEIQAHTSTRTRPAISTTISCKSLSVFMHTVFHTPFFKCPVAVSEMLHPLPVAFFSTGLTCHFFSWFLD